MRAANQTDKHTDGYSSHLAMAKLRHCIGQQQYRWSYYHHRHDDSKLTTDRHYTAHVQCPVWLVSQCPAVHGQQAKHHLAAASRWTDSDSDSQIRLATLPRLASRPTVVIGVLQQQQPRRRRRQRASVDTLASRRWIVSLARPSARL